MARKSGEDANLPVVLTGLFRSLNRMFVLKLRVGADFTWTLMWVWRLYKPFLDENCVRDATFKLPTLCELLRKENLEVENVRPKSLPPLNGSVRSTVRVLDMLTSICFLDICPPSFFSGEICEFSFDTETPLTLDTNSEV